MQAQYAVKHLEEALVMIKWGQSKIIFNSTLTPFMLLLAEFLSRFKLVPTLGYQLKAGQSAKSGNCVARRKLFITGLMPNSETSKPELLSQLKLGAFFVVSMSSAVLARLLERRCKIRGTIS